jgi:hypothetical protein
MNLQKSWIQSGGKSCKKPDKAVRGIALSLLLRPGYMDSEKIPVNSIFAKIATMGKSSANPSCRRGRILLIPPQHCGQLKEPTNQNCYDKKDINTNHQGFIACGDNHLFILCSLAPCNSLAGTVA